MEQARRNSWLSAFGMDDGRRHAESNENVPTLLRGIVYKPIRRPAQYYLYTTRFAYPLKRSGERSGCENEN